MAGELVLTLWTDDLRLALAAEAAGVDRIGPDLEQAGKRERQSGLGTWISEQRPGAIAELAAALTVAEPFARIDPIGPGSAAQIETVVGLGARVVMLPMFRSAANVAEALELIDGRATLVPLAETAGALACVGELTALPGVEEVHVGINDLAIDLGLSNRFDVLTDPRVEEFCGRATAAGLRLGVGGFARPRDLELPLEPDLVYALVARLGASAALLARTFVDRESTGADLARDVAELRSAFEAWREAPRERLERARERAVARISEIGSW